MNHVTRWILCLSIVLLWGCRDENESKQHQIPLFELLSPASTGIQFTNQIIDDKEFNIFNYRNFYNGGGVGIGDINNDGWSDILLVSNMGENKLYLNKGNEGATLLEFEDITLSAGVAGKRAWSTGVTFADINGDSLLDIYVCNAGNRSNDDRVNELYINNGDLTFTEQAAKYGLDDKGYSTHAAFFDYDRDGDLDMYLLNNSFIPVNRLGYQNLRSSRDIMGGDKLFRNDGDKFTDVSEEAGIYGSIIGFGLGITIGDVNNDNWPDIFISNDFYEKDYLYINNRNGSFTEASNDWMQHQSLSSMGADIADINNDGHLDIFVTDMLPGNDIRLKTTSSFENYDLFQLKLSKDFSYQYMQNTLHLNNGAGAGKQGAFSEVARLAGVYATDWSWGALLFDMDNDGLKDIFVANGIAKELTNQDFMSFLAHENTIQQVVENNEFDLKLFLDKMPINPIPNYAFKNTGNLQFENKAAVWGLGEPGFSNGAAYGDLDNDGDLDLVVNNVNSPASIFKNNTSKLLNNHYLRVNLKGYASNLNAIGTKVLIHQKDKNLYQQQMPNRGFQSSVDLFLVFGLGSDQVIDSITVVWPDDKMQVLKKVKADQQIVLDYKNADQFFMYQADNEDKPFYDATQQVKLNYTHQESTFIDYNRDPLLKQMLSTQGPALATGDIDGDGLEDVYIGGAAGQAKKLFMQKLDGTFIDKTPLSFQNDDIYEDVDAVFFDANGDGHLDLFIVTGSNEFESGTTELMDRLYINDGKGVFNKDSNLPAIAENGSCIAAADFDNDGDIDLFIGGRMIPGRYGQDPRSYLYINDGTGSFKNYTKRYLPSNELGMVTAAAWADVDGDNYPELIVAGDWMPITIYKNSKGKQLGLSSDGSAGGSEVPYSSGWWNTIQPVDLDGDGDIDFIVGNMGSNSRLKASKEQPAELYVADFDNNGIVEQIISNYTEDGKTYPMVLKGDLQKQVPGIKKKFIKYIDYAGKQIGEIFPEEILKEAVVKKAETPYTSYLINEGNLNFTLKALPVEAQFSPVFCIDTLDYNRDGYLDVLLTGNFYDVLPELGRYDANYGLLMQGNGKGDFKVVKSQDSGFFVKGQVRKMGQIKGKNGQILIILAKNNDKLQIFGKK
jgi:hypothetical protein